jgi:hypothetical protein
LFLEFLGSLPDLDSDLLLLLSRAQTPDRSLGDLGRSGVAVNLVQQGRVKFSLRVDRCGGLPDLTTDGTLFFFSLSREWSTQRRDPTPLINRWRKSQNGRLIFLALVSGGLWLRWHRGVSFSFVSIVSIGLVTTECSLEVVIFFILLEDGYEIFKAETLLIVFVVVEVSVSNHVVEDAGFCQTSPPTAPSSSSPSPGSGLRGVEILRC